jgi:hypothetical protein
LKKKRRIECKKKNEEGREQEARLAEVVKEKLTE